MTLRPQQVAKIRSLLRDFSADQVQKLTGFGANTIARYTYRGEGPCRCGKVVGHRGRCTVRYFELRHKRMVSRLERQKAMDYLIEKRERKKALSSAIKVPKVVPFRAPPGELGAVRKQVVDAFMEGDMEAYRQGVGKMIVWLRKMGIKSKEERTEVWAESIRAMHRKRREQKLNMLQRTGF